MKNIILLLFISTLSYSQTVKGVVIKCYDGDTYAIKLEDSTKIKVRVIGIDCPEIVGYSTKLQPYGDSATIFVKEMLLNKNVEVVIKSKDVYGRYLAKILIDSVDISYLLLNKGLATYNSTSIIEDRHNLKKVKNTAKRNKIGIWSKNDFITPKKWRKIYKRT